MHKEITLRGTRAQAPVVRIPLGSGTDAEREARRARKIAAIREQKKLLREMREAVRS